MGCASSREADPWSLASQGNTAQLSQWLINSGNANAVDTLKGRGSLLHAAAAADHVDCVKLLLKNGANVDIKTPEHGTPLHAAAASGASNAVTQLLANRACTTARFDGNTAAEVAQQKGYPAIARYIQMNHGTPAADAGHDSRSNEPSTSSGPAAAAQHQPPAPPQQQHALMGYTSRSGTPLSPAQRQMEKLQAQQQQAQQRERDRSALALAKQQMRKADAAPSPVPTPSPAPSLTPTPSAELVQRAGTSDAAELVQRQRGGAPPQSPSLPAPRQQAQGVGPSGAAAAVAAAQYPRPGLLVGGRAVPRGMPDQVRASRPAGGRAVLQRQSDSLERERLKQELIAWAAAQPPAAASSSGGSAHTEGDALAAADAAALCALLQPSPAAAGAAQALPLSRSGSGRLSPQLPRGGLGCEPGQSPPRAQQAQQADDHSDPSTPAAGSQPYAANPTFLDGPPEQGNGREDGGGSKEGSMRGGGRNGRAEGAAGARGVSEAHASPLLLAPGMRASPATNNSGRPSLARVPSDQALGGADGADGAPSTSEENSREGSADNSLLDDPLLKFLKQAMTRQPSLLSRASPFSLASQLNGHVGLGAVHGNSGAGPGASQQLSPAPSSKASDELQLPKPGSGSGRLYSSGSGMLSSMGSIVVDIRPWQIDFADLHLQKKTIGEGSFGKVYVAKWHETLVAVKVLLDLEEVTQQSAEMALTLSNPILHNLQKECALMAGLRHPNVVQFMGVSAMPPAMITEYCARGSLNDVLRACNTSKSKASQMTWLRRLNIALDATKGMLYLHRKGIIHRDLKSPNLLVESTWRVKVADFNLSKIVEDTSSGRSTIANMNPRWLAPEILNGEPASTASDVFSWGVVMWELLTFQCPWPHASPWALVGKLMDGHRLPIPPRHELPGHDTPRFPGLDGYIALMQRCWSQAPADRPDFEEVIHELRKLLEGQARNVATPS